MRNGSAYIRPNRSRPRAAARGPFGYCLANGDGALIHPRRRDHGEEALAEIGRGYIVSGWTIARLA